MAELVLDGDVVTGVVTVLRRIGGYGCDSSCPSVAYCGSDEVIRAFATAFGLLRDQDANVRASWCALGDRGVEAVDAMTAADAALAGATA